MKYLTLLMAILLITSCNSDAKDKTISKPIVESVNLEIFNNSICNDTLGIDLPSCCNNIEVKEYFEGVKNFREITLLADNPIQIRRNQLFRSDALHKLTEADISKLKQMGVKTIVDFRSKIEIEDYPDREILGIKNINLPIGKDPADMNNLINKEDLKKIRTYFIDGRIKEVDSLLKNLNIDLEKDREKRYTAFANSFKKQLSEFMKLLADKNNLPLVFHCQGGKDRTGFASALILKTLGADEQSIMNDYLTTNMYTYSDVAKSYLSGSEYLKPAFGAHQSQMKAALSAVDKKYGSFLNYFKDGLNLTNIEIEKIRKNLLGNK